MGKLYLGSTAICSAHMGTEINNQDATFTENGIYQVPTGKTGYGQVTVNVPSSFKPELTNLKTIYTTKNSVSNGSISSTIYPYGTKDELLVSNERYSSAQSISYMSGFVTDFTFPQTISQLKFEMKIKLLNNTYTHFLIGYSGNNNSDRFYFPAFQRSYTNSHLTINFSSNGTSWALSNGDTGYTVSNNIWTNLSLEFFINSSNKVEIKLLASTNNDELVQVYNNVTSVSSIVSPLTKNNLLSLFYGVTGSNNTYVNSAVYTDLTKLKITVNDEVMVNGSELL